MKHYEIGLFESDDAAMLAIETLKEKGLDGDDISVLAKRPEDLDMIELETGIPVEGGLDKPQSNKPFLNLSWFAWPMQGGATRYIGAGPVAWAALADREDPKQREVKEELKEAGLTEDEREQCRAYMEAGNIVVLVGKNRLEKETLDPILGNVHAG